MRNVGVGLVLFYFLVLGFGGYGWVCNIITLYHSTFTPITGQLVLRIVGIFLPPLGAIMGYI